MMKISKQLTYKTGELIVHQVSYNLQFWILLIITILSLICSIFIIYRYIFNSTMRNGLHNHSIVLIIIINALLIITDVSWMLDNLHRSGRVWLPTNTFCLIWWFIDDSLYSIQTFILAWASIERHLLIFHLNYIRTKNQKIFYHYLPPIIIMIYLFCFYLFVLIYPPCQNEYDFNEIECGSNPCYLNIKLLSIWDLSINNIIPTFIIAIFNILLLYRVILQKKRLRQPIQWRKHRRMSMQLLSISAVYLFIHLPMIVIMLIQLNQGEDPQIGFGTQLYIFILTYSVTLSLPFVVCISRLSIDKHRGIRIAPTITFEANKKSIAIIG